MATSGLYGNTAASVAALPSGSETSGLYGNNTVFGGTYFEYFIFQDAATQPATPTGGSWSFTTNVGTPPTGWSNNPPANPTYKVWISIALVNSKSSATYIWSTPGLMSAITNGTVTSVGLSAPSFLSVSGSPVTTNGTLALSYSGTALPVSNGGTGVTTSTGTGNTVLSTSPTLVTPNLGIPSSVTLTNATGLPLSTGVTGTLPIANGGTGTTTPSLVAGTNVTITGSWPNQTINSTGGGGGGSGTVTSVAATVPSFLSVSGSPITTSGTLAFSYSGTALPVANGGTGVTTSTGANSIVLRDANQNITVNALNEGFTSVAASGTTITLIASSNRRYTITGSGGQVITLPNATTLQAGNVFYFDNNQTSGAITVNNNSGTLVVSVPSGGYVSVYLLDNSIAAGSWDRHDAPPSNVSWSTNTFDYSGSITSAQWNGTTVAYNRGGTGQSSAFIAGGVVYGLTTTAMAVTAAGTSGQVLISAGASAPTFSSNIDGIVIGNTTPAAGTFTTLIGGAGSANYGQLTGGATTKAVQFQTLGTDTNISVAIQPKGTGAIDLAAGSQGVNISNGGTVTAITRTNGGTGYTVAPTITFSDPTTVGGVRATATCTVTAGVVDTAFTITNPGSGYVEQPTITFTPVSGGSGATAYAAVGGSSIIRALGLTGTASLDFYTPAGISTGIPNFRLRDQTGDSYWQSSNQSQTAILQASGNSNAIAMIIASGTGNVSFRTGGGNQYEQMRVANTTSAINYLKVTGGTSGSPAPVISVDGSTTPDLDLTLTPKGAGRVNITTSIKPKVNSAANVTSPLAWNSTSYDEYAITALANALTINADANASPADGQRMMFRFKDNGTARALTWTTGSTNSFRVVGVTLPTTTVASKLVYIGCIYNSADSRWDAVAVSQEA
jgi:hypothetical protein